MRPRGCNRPPCEAFALDGTFLRKPLITPTMSTQPTRRPKWEIDRALEALIGRDIRVAAKSFSPPPRPGDTKLRLTPVEDLFLPDNSQPAGLPVFFEGRLLKFDRQIGVVFVHLGAPAALDGSSEGIVLFRGTTTVMVRGPAVVELTSPFKVERLPADPENYWRDLRLPRAQFELPFPAPAVDEGAGPELRQADFGRCLAPGPPTLTLASSASVGPERGLPPVDLPPSNTIDQNNGLKAVKGESCRSQPRPNQTPIRSLNYSP